MREIRICDYQAALSEGTLHTLSTSCSAHLCTVLRKKNGFEFRLFDGRGHEFKAVLRSSGTKVQAEVGEPVCTDTESPLHTELGQVISRNGRMEFTVQKAVELGISAITPLFSERCGVRLDAERAHKKRLQWQKIAIAACEQCGRAVVPVLHPVLPLDRWLEKGQSGTALRLVLDPRAERRIAELKATPEICLLAGPEGGLSPAELKQALSCGFIGVRMGPRILRTETAALAALSILGSCFGDL